MGFKLKLLFLVNLIIISYIEATPVINEDVIDERDLKSYMEVVKKNADLTVDPCDDFAKYACGNMNQSPRMKTIHRLVTFIEPMFIESEPQNEAERKVRDLHLSCMKVFMETQDDDLKRIKYILEQIPDIKFYSDNKEVTSKDIAKIIIKLQMMGAQYESINIDLNSFKLYIFGTYHYNKGQIENILKAVMDEDGTENINKLVKDIVDFLNAKRKEEHLNVEPKEITVNSIDELITLIPSKHLNWNEIYTEFKNEYGSIKNEITIENIELLKELIKIIDTTDIRTVMNYYTLRYIQLLSKINCMDLDFFYRYAILSRLWNDNFSDETTVDRFVKFLDEYEVLLKQGEKIDFQIFDYIYKKLNKKRNIAKNYKTILSDKIRDDYYNKVNIDKDNYYKNIVQVFKNLVKDMNQYNMDDEKVQNSTEFGLKFGHLDDTISSNFKNMPYIHLYSTIGFDIWKEIFNYNKPSFTTDSITKECSNTSTISFVDNFDLLRSFSSQKLAYFGMLHNSDSSNSKLHKEKELIESKHIDKDFTDLKKLYFITLAQHRCESQETKLTDNIFKVLQNSMEFSEHFKCPADSQMSKTITCKLEKCDQDFKKYSLLLPINPGECQQNIFE